MKEWICKEEPVYDLDCNITDYDLSVITELIRCKDCKHHNEYSECEIWELHQTSDADYCSNGEKK